MKVSKSKTVLAIAVCAVITAIIIALPSLVFEAKDDAMLGGDYTAPRSERADSLSSEGMANETARALYIDHTYVTDRQSGRTTGAGGQHELDSLKAAGVVPERLFLADDMMDVSVDACIITVEPISGVVTSVWWNGEGVKKDTMFESYINYLGLSDAEDWQHIEYKRPYQNDTILGRYSPSLQVYITSVVTDDDKCSNVNASSQTQVEMEPLLNSMQAEKGLEAK